MKLGFCYFSFVVLNLEFVDFLCEIEVEIVCNVVVFDNDFLVVCLWVVLLLESVEIFE